MKDNRYCVIMAGGVGNNFWPISREGKPKQFLEALGSGRSLSSLTYERFSKIVPQENIFIVTLARFKDMVMEQIPSIKEENILLEPYSRHTAPCIAYSTYHILKKDPNAVVAVSPADHIILDEKRFSAEVEAAIEYARDNDVLMTIGIQPSFPSSNYGYIQAKKSASDLPEGNKPLKVKTFTEKPDKALADVFIKSGEFFWNSGIFIWKASVIKEEMERYLPEVTSPFKGWEADFDEEGKREFLQKAYTDCPKISIDYGVMEKTEKAWIYPGNFGWTDIDSWDYLYETLSSKDSHGNFSNTKKVLTKDSYKNLLLSTNHRKLLAIKGLENYMVIDTDDVLLVCPKDDKQFKDIVSGTGMPEYEDFR